MSWPHENMLLLGPTQMVSAGHAIIVTDVHNVVKLDTVLIGVSKP